MIKSYVFPGDIDEQIASIGAKPFIYMRTDEFSGINLESERMLLELIHCSAGRTIIYTGSGTGERSGGELRQHPQQGLRRGRRQLRAQVV